MLGTIREIVDNNVILDLTIDITKQANLLNLHIKEEFYYDSKRTINNS